MIGKLFILVFLHSIFRQHVNIVLQGALASTIKKKIALVGDAYSRPPITIKFHNLHAETLKWLWVK
jgi:hypothetical protein